MIEGTRDILPKRSLLIRPQEVRVRVLPPVDVAAFGRDDRALREAVHERMADGLAELRRSFKAVGLASTEAHASSRAAPAKAGDPRSA